MSASKQRKTGGGGSAPPSTRWSSSKPDLVVQLEILFRRQNLRRRFGCRSHSSRLRWCGKAVEAFCDCRSCLLPGRRDPHPQRIDQATAEVGLSAKHYDELAGPA